jgi:phosphate-selective porin OprO and OprP
MNIELWPIAQLAMVRWVSTVLPVVTVLCVTVPQPASAQRASPAARDTSDAQSDTAGKPAQTRKWRFVHRNELETPFMTLRIGAAVLFDYAWHDQDAASREQVALSKGGPPPPAETVDRPTPHVPTLRGSVGIPLVEEPAPQGSAPGIEQTYRFRDTRVLLGGIIKTPREIKWSAGIMWDAVTRKWLMRQTGFVIPVPELWGHLWIGRSKEGTSLNRVMVGYDGWTMERFTFSDASIPLLVDGVRWMGYVPNQHLLWNVGIFADPLSRGQTFSSYRHQFASRVAYVRQFDDSATVLHIGGAFRIGRPTNDTLQLRSKPESTTAPNYIDTGKFPSTLSGLIGTEAYYRRGSWLFGGEYYIQQAASYEADDPIFHGGDIVATWLVSGETRPYTTVGGYFRSITPKSPLFEGGWGALELVLRASYSDLATDSLTGGRFWRISPTVNWYLNRNLRLELGYGYGVLDRFAMKGRTHFLQTRLQSQL